MTGSYVNLHTHSVYSNLDGLSNADAYMQRAAELGMNALALTDHGHVSGLLDFYDAGKKHGIKPILGMEAYMARNNRFDDSQDEKSGKARSEFDQRGPYHLTVLARNYAGYKNLIKLSSDAYTEGLLAGKARIDLELLDRYSEGLIILTGCLSGAVCQAIMRDDVEYGIQIASTMQDIVGKDNFYIEVMNHGIDEEINVLPALVHVAEQIGAKVVPTGDCHYANKADSASHDAMLAVSTGASLSDENRFSFVPEEFYLKSYDEMAARFKPEWLQNTQDLADGVELELEFGTYHFPEYQLPKGVEDEVSYFEQQVWEGIKARYGYDYSKEIQDRTNYEIRVIKEMGFPTYFLVVADIVDWAKNNGVKVGPARGSAGGSIVSYALGITDVCPIKFKLLFERFLVEGRQTMPDIDIDFDDRYRDKVVDYVRNKYGHEKVAHISTFASVKPRSAIRDATRILDYDYQTGDKLAKLVPPAVMGVEKTFEQAMQSSDLSTAYHSDKDVRTIIDKARGLEGILRQSGVHPAGVVISKGAVSDYVPVLKRKAKGDNEAVVATQWDMNRVEQCGLLKVDFLGLRNLGTIDLCYEIIYARRGERVSDDSIPLDDDNAFKLLREGHTAGVFQLESAGIRGLTVDLQPESIEDISAINALYRPGPLMANVHNIYIDGKNGKKRKAAHPMLDKMLEDTYGVILYQEDILKVASEMAGFSPNDADLLRSAVGKKKMDKIKLYREQFVEGCAEKHGIDREISNKIYSDIEFFGGYGFGRGHSIAYSIISYRTAYLKANYPVEYMTALLSTSDKKEAINRYINECRDMGIKVLPPSLNGSDRDFKIISDTEILFGLHSINGIGTAVTEDILELRKTEDYRTVYDFFRRLSPEYISKATFERLLVSGALDELITLPEDYNRRISRDERMDILGAEYDALGAFLTQHPLDGLDDLLKSKVTCTIEDIYTLNERDRVVVGGIISSVQRKVTRNAQTMYIVTLRDLTGDVEVIIFPKQAQDFVPEKNSIVVINGNVNFDGDDDNPTAKVILFAMEKLDIPQYGLGKLIKLELENKPEPAMLDAMVELINSRDGESSVIINFPDSGYRMSMAFKRTTDESVETELKQLIQEGT